MVMCNSITIPESFKKWLLYLLFMCIPLLIISILGTASRTALLILPICGLIWFGFKLLASKNKFYVLIVGLFTIIILTSFGIKFFISLIASLTLSLRRSKFVPDLFETSTEITGLPDNLV